jgi:hypothetical protein
LGLKGVAMGKVAVMGIGDLGGSVLRILAQMPEVSRLYALDVDEARLATEAADAGAVSSYVEGNKRIEPVAVDMRNTDALAATLARIQPDVVVNTATLQSWWVITQLPQSLWRRLEEQARFGPWLPMHLTLALKLMQALRAAGLASAVVNLAFPDVVNPALAGLGLAPTCGAGNSDLLRAGIRWAAARRLNVPVRDVAVSVLGHHFHVAYFWMELERKESLIDHPYWLRVLVGDADVTAELGAESLLVEAGRALPRGRAIMARTAASAVEKVRYLLQDNGGLTHAPGPAGLAGGYDVRLSRSGARVVLPQGVSFEQARTMMEQTQRGDGIESIQADGSVVFGRTAYETMLEVLGYDCPVLRPNESEARADELRARLETLSFRGT